MPGVVGPETKEEAAAFLDMVEELLSSVRDLVSKALEQRQAADTYVGGPLTTPPRAAATEKKALDAQKLAWRRVRFAERHIAEKAVAMGSTAVFVAYVSEDLGWSDEEYVVYLQRLVRGVFELRETMQENFPEDTSTATAYSLSAHGLRLKTGQCCVRVRGRGARGEARLLHCACAVFGSLLAKICYRCSLYLALHLTAQGPCGDEMKRTAPRR